MASLDFALQGFISEVLQIVRGIPHLRYVPDNPPLQVPFWPMVTMYASSGTVNTEGQPSGIFKELHNPSIAVVVPLDNLERANEFMLPLIQAIPYEIKKGLIHDGRSGHAHTFGEIEYTLGPIEWPQGLDMFGLLFTINNVKVENTVS